jgi:Tfp pilus assembly protein PilO
MKDKLQKITFGHSLLIGIVLTTVYYFSLYDDGTALNNQISSTRTQLENTTKELESLKKAIQDAERFKVAMVSLGAEMDRILLAIPAKLTSLDLMKIVSTEAKNVGVEINNINSQGKGSFSRQEDSVQFYESVPITISLTGSYNQSMLFLSNLTKLDKIVVARNLSLNSASAKLGSTGNPVLNASMTVEAFRYLSEDDSKGKKTAGRGGK